LHVDGAPDSIDRTREFDHHRVAGRIEDAPLMLADERIEHLPIALQATQRFLFVGSDKFAVASDVAGQNSGDFAPHSEPRDDRGGRLR
jgi:hypothetical protein